MLCLTVLARGRGLKTLWRFIDMFIIRSFRLLLLLFVFLFILLALRCPLQLLHFLDLFDSGGLLAAIDVVVIGISTTCNNFSRFVTRLLPWCLIALLDRGGLRRRGIHISLSVFRRSFVSCSWKWCRFS